MRIRDALERAGHTVFQDRTSIKGGDDWVATIEAGLRQAYAVVTVISEHTASNRWVRIETLSALSLGKLIVPISLAAGHIPFEILHINVIDASIDLSAGIERLLLSLPQPQRAGAEDTSAASPPVRAAHTTPGDVSASGRSPLLRYVVRLASDLVERLEIGIPFVAFLGSGCVLAANDDSAARLRKAITGSPSYDALLAYGHALDPRELTAVLRRHLAGLEPPPVYRSVASLAAAGWLGLIVTVNVDVSLEQALADAGLAAHEIEKLVAGERSVPELLAVLERPSPGLRLLKVSGDIDAGIRQTFGADEADTTEWERVLASIFRHDTIVIGHRHGDPDLVSCLPAKGDLVWLLDPQPPPGPRLRAILDSRKSSDRYVGSDQHGLHQFLAELARVLTALTPKEQTEDGSTRALAASGTSPAAPSRADTDRIRRLAKLQDELALLQRKMHAQGLDDSQPSAAESEIMDRIGLEIDALSQAGEGTILGGFRIQSELGHGGIGHVYRAVHIFTGLQAVVKIMSRDRAADPVMRSRFFRGARVMATLNHPNIVRVLDLGGIVGPWNYYVMEYIEGSNLEIVLAADALDESGRWQMSRAIVEAISIAHTQPEGPIVHRDIKPANILVDSRGNIKVTDFDTAFLEDSGPLTHLVTAPFGTSFYAPPELDMAPTLAELRDPRVDVFALGRVLFRMFTGVPTVERSAVHFSANPDMMRFALSGRVPGPAASPLSLLLRRAMDYDPEQRFATAAEMLEALTRVHSIAASVGRGSLPAIDLSFARTEPGAFIMGSPRTEPGRDQSEEQHQVMISHGLLASRTPVTRLAWATVWGEDPPDTASAALPMETVSWYEALSFCNALSLYVGLTPCYTIEDTGIGWDRIANGFRLPTEAEWEYLCRAGTSTIYNRGSAEQDLARAGWYERNCESGPVPVGQKEPNAWGLYDMHGNVWEWCWDWFGPYPQGDQEDPEGPATGRSRVLRGGSWRRSLHHCRSATRYESSPENHGKSLSFRVVRTLADP
jgi:serine/threonine protein kinase